MNATPNSKGTDTSVTKQSVVPQTSVAYVASNALAATPNFHRERKANRLNRVKHLLSTPLTFLSPLGLEYAKLIRDGGSLDILGQKISSHNLNPLRCAICNGIHGAPTKDEQIQGEGIKAERLARTELFSSNGKLVAFSETCVEQYLKPNATAQTISNFAVFAEYHSLPTKQIVK